MVQAGYGAGGTRGSGEAAAEAEAHSQPYSIGKLVSRSEFMRQQSGQRAPAADYNANRRHMRMGDDGTSKLLQNVWHYFGAPARRKP